MITADDPFVSFAVTLVFVGPTAALGVWGEVDLLTAPALGAIMGTAIDQGHRSVVLDLAGCDFMDASGLRVIADGAHRLGLSGGVLTIRSPSARVRHVLDIAGMSDLARLEPSGQAGGHLGLQQSAGPPAVAVRTGPDRPALHLRKVTAIPADDDVVDGALRLVVSLARAVVGGADGVSVSLRRHGCLDTVAASDQTISTMDAAQYATGEGPCVDASVEGRWFHAEALHAETRWPTFTPRARALGINAILSTPLVARDRPVGALNIYSRTADAFTSEDQKMAAVFAAGASAILTDVSTDVADDQLSMGLVQALRTRQVINLAQGVMMERDGIGEDEAYAALQRNSTMTGTSLRDRAEDIVGSTRWLVRDRLAELRTDVLDEHRRDVEPSHGEL